MILLCELRGRLQRLFSKDGLYPGSSKAMPWNDAPWLPGAPWQAGRTMRAQRAPRPGRDGASPMRQAFRTLIPFSSMSAVLLLAGCGSNLGVAAGAISVANSSGSTSVQLTELATGETAYLKMTPIGDSLNAGVNWTVLCEGSPVTGSRTGGACGTISPAHTAAGAFAVYTAPAVVPIGSTVTIDASPASNPSALSSVTFTIVSPAISIAFASTPPTSLAVNSTTPLVASLTNDTTAGGANWTATCGSEDCGSFNPTATASYAGTVYTAPATVPTGNTVTLTATSAADATKSVSATVTIVSAYPISIGVSPTTLQIGKGASESANLIATVANDEFGAGVDWSVSCSASSCGRFSPPHTLSGAETTYYAPPAVPSGGTVTITATATATESKATPTTATATATILSSSTVAVTVTALPSTVITDANSTLKAVVSNDSTNSGVSWSVSCATSGACGSIADAGGSNGTYTATYTAPSSVPGGGLVTITATPLAATLQGNPGMATVAVTTAPPSIAFSQQPLSSLTVNGKTRMIAAVTDDPSASGVTWSVSCISSIEGGCGYVQPYETASGSVATYTAPPFVPSGATVTITATSLADSSVSVSTTTAIAASTALSVGFVPSTPTQVEAGNTVNLNAAVSNDSTSAGVDWSVCSSGCGYFTTTPEIPAIPATTKTAYVPEVPAVIATSVQGWPNGLPIAYTAPTIAPAGGAVVITATAHAGTSATTAASVTITSANSGPALAGVVQAGSLPVVGARVALYAAGASGYGSASSLVFASGQNAYVTTDSNGAFTITGGFPCPSATSQMYLVSAGGQAGTNGPNENLALMTLLGPCGSLNSSSLVVNEVTTAAAAWSVAPFAANPIASGLTSYLYIGSSSSNTTGLANAFASFNNLVNPTTGQALFTVPAGNAVVPFAEIDTLADILNVCSVTGGGASGDGSACGNLFYYANPYATQTETEYSGVPYDTLQAVFEIVQNPFFNGQGVGHQTAMISEGEPYLYEMATPASPFQPILSSEPNDFSLSLNYTGGGGLSSTSNANYFALDKSGDLWFTNTATSNVTEWDNQGAAMTSSSGYTTGTLAAPGPIAIDASGNAWICGENGLTELDFVGEELTDLGSPFGGGGLTSAGCLNMAIDGSGNVWATNSGAVIKFDDLGDPLSPSAGYTIAISPEDSDTATVQQPLAIDDSGNVWVGVSGVPGYTSNLYLAELNNASGEPNDLSPNPVSGPATNFVIGESIDLLQTQIAVGHSGTVWVPQTGTTGLGGLDDVAPYGGLGTTDTISSAVDCTSGGTCPFASPRGIALDGGGTVWVGNAGADVAGAVKPANLSAFNPALSLNYPGFLSSSLASRPLSVAVDGSGNVWLLLDNDTVTEYVGIATPTVTPLSLAVKKQKLGAKP